MTLAGRSSRRGGGRRWLVVGLVITLLVLLVDASIKSRSPTPGRQLAAQAWVDRALAIVVQSNVQAADLNGLRTATTTGMTAGQVTADLDALETGAAAAYTRLLALHEPVLLQSSAGLLETCLLVRKKAAAAIATAVEASLRSGTAAAAAAAAGGVAGAVQQLEVSDEAYRLFARSLPARYDSAPTSTWITDPGEYGTTVLQVFLTALQHRVSLAPVHLLSILSVSTTPSPIRSTGPRQSVEVLSPSSSLSVTAVIGDIGNQYESDLSVTASLSRSSGAAAAHQTVSLAAGGAITIQFAPLGPPIGAVVTLTVAVRPPAGSPTRPVTQSIQFEMPAPTSATTTTTTPATTAPGGTATTTPST